MAAGVAGCSAVGGGTPAPATSPDPAAVLAAAAGKMGTQPAHFTVSMRFGHGTTHSQHRGHRSRDRELRVRLGLVHDAPRRRPDVYVKITKPFLPGLAAADLGHWIRRPIPPTSDLTFALAKDFPWAPARRAANGTAITSTGAHSFHGLFAPSTWATPATGPTQDFGETSRWAAQLRGTAWPETPSTAGPASDPANGFLVNLDAEGRFIRVRVGLGLQRPPVLTYSDYGTPVNVTAPPRADLVDDPALDVTMVELY